MDIKEAESKTDTYNTNRSIDREAVKLCTISDHS